MRFAAAGSWVGWTARDIGQGSSAPTCTVQRIDMAAASAETETLPATSDPAVTRLCGQDVTIGATGAMAWVAVGMDGAGGMLPMQLNAAAATVTTVTTFDTAAQLELWKSLPFADIAISADGRTLSWRNGDVRKSAPLPGAP